MDVGFNGIGDLRSFSGIFHLFLGAMENNQEFIRFNRCFMFDHTVLWNTDTEKARFRRTMENRWDILLFLKFFLTVNRNLKYFLIIFIRVCAVSNQLK